MNPSLDVITVGAGIGGLCAAIALQKTGCKLLLCEAASQFAPIGAGLMLAPNANNALNELGVWQAVSEVGYAIKKFELKSQSGKVLVPRNFEEEKERFGFPFMGIHRAALHQALLQRLPPDAVKTGMKCKGFTASKSGVSVHFENGETLHAKLLIGADGIHSIIRKQLFPQTKLRYGGYTCWRGLCKHDCPPQSSESWGWGERFGILPLAPDLAYWFMVKNAPARDLDMSAWDKERMAHVFEHWHEPVAELIEKTEETNIIWDDIFDLAPMQQWGQGCITLLGDAAHATTPNLGQGACQAIEDAVVLGNAITKHGLNENALRQYEKKRVKRANLITKRSWQMGLAAHYFSNPVVNFFRDLIVPYAPEFIQRRQMDWMLTTNFEV